MKIISGKIKEAMIAYFSAEFAIDNDLPTYSGGLGVLAGDLMHAAADMDEEFIGIGILYKGREFEQRILPGGEEIKANSQFDHDTSFLRQTKVDGKPLLIVLDLGSTTVSIKPYEIRLSENTIMYYLSTDVDGNPPEWAGDMDALYAGNNASQIRQQLILGIGGMKLIEALGIKPQKYHINEGRPGLIIWELADWIRKEEGISYEVAFNKARKQIVYTNHTLVAAGNLNYSMDEMVSWAQAFSKMYGVDTSFLIKDGLSPDGQSFSITRFALVNSSTHSAVSRVHKEYAQKEWPDFEWTYVTNGVHLPRWQDSDFRLGDISDREIWEQHMIKKRELAETVGQRTGYSYDPNRLVITWARRLAEYKQPKIIFSDLRRLMKIVKDTQRPVQLLFAGNSHSADPTSKKIIEDIIKIMSNELSGYAIFVPNYNIALANHMTSGSDVWLNTPKGNLEACGTSGMKAISNGVLNCTVLDGWTYEVDWNGIGWTLDPGHVAENFYTLLEKEIVPMYYTRNDQQIPEGWIGRMRKSIELADRFSARRMLSEYKQKLYL